MTESNHDSTSKRIDINPSKNDPNNENLWNLNFLKKEIAKNNEEQRKIDYEYGGVASITATGAIMGAGETYQHNKH